MTDGEFNYLAFFFSFFLSIHHGDCHPNKTLNNPFLHTQKSIWRQKMTCLFFFSLFFFLLLFIYYLFIYLVLPIEFRASKHPMHQHPQLYLISCKLGICDLVFKKGVNKERKIVKFNFFPMKPKDLEKKFFFF